MPVREIVQQLPPRARRWLFVGFGVAGLVLTAIQAAYGALDGATLPDWMAVAWAVYGVLGTAFGATAGGNVNAQPVTTEPVIIIPDGTGKRRQEPVTSEALDVSDHSDTTDR